jgi:hypothetical protein
MKVFRIGILNFVSECHVCFYPRQYGMVFLLLWHVAILTSRNTSHILPLSIHNVPHQLFRCVTLVWQIGMPGQSSVNKRAFVYSHGSCTIIKIAMSPYAAGQL